MFTITTGQLRLALVSFWVWVLVMVWVTLVQLLWPRERRERFRLDLRVQLFLTAAVLCFYGIGALISGIRQIPLALASNGWKEVSGEIVSVKLDHYPPESAIGLTSPVIVYQYQPDDRILHSRMVAVGQGGSFNPEYAREIVRRYPAGQEVLVHFDPERPTLAVLEPGVSPQVFSLPGMGLVFLGLAAGLVYCGRYFRPEKRPKSKRGRVAQNAPEIKPEREPGQDQVERKLQPSGKHIAVPLPRGFTLEQADGRLKITGADRHGLFRAAFPNRMEMTVEAGRIEIKQSSFRTKVAHFETANIEQLYVKEVQDFSETYPNKTVSGYHYNLYLVTREGKHFPLLTGLTASDQGVYLEQEIERYLGLVDRETLAEAATEGQVNRAEESKQISWPELAAQRCLACLGRCVAYPIRLAAPEAAAYYGCQSCRQSRSFIPFEGRIIAILDGQQETDLLG